MAIDLAEIKKRLSVILEDENLANEYIRRFGPTMDMKNIRKIKDARKKETHEETSTGEDPIYEVQVRCPVCNQDKITVYELRAKSQQVVTTFFMVPLYTGAMGYRTVNYSRLAVTVCPRCLFASPDKKDFIAQSTTSRNTVSQIAPNIIMTLQERIGERKALLRSVSDPVAYFKRPRGDDAVILSYRLALMRAAVEAYYETPYAYFKMGSYGLKTAQIIKAGGGNNEEQLKESLEFFSDSFRLSNCPTEDLEYQTIYTIIALQMRLGQQAKAASYISVFDRIQTDLKRKMREDPKVTLITIEKWQNKAKLLWEDRENVELFKDC